MRYGSMLTVSRTAGLVVRNRERSDRGYYWAVGSGKDMQVENGGRNTTNVNL